MTFYDAFKFVIGEEGGYVNNPSDPGGETKYGISKRAYPLEDIANLTLDRAQFLYKRDYWDLLDLDNRPYGAALCIFDCAVNQGPGVAKSILASPQINPLTGFVVSFQAERILYYSRLATWTGFGRGWMRRILRTAIEANSHGTN